MAKPFQCSWQQLAGESNKAYQAFGVYRDLEPKERSLARVASECTRSVSLIRRWSAQWSWVERAREWDHHQEVHRLEKLIEAKQKMDEDHLKIIRGARSKAIQALADMKPERLATNPSELRRWILDLIRYERLIMGEPETTEVRREKVQIHATIEEQIKEYAPVFQELLDEGAITLDGHHDRPKHERGEDEGFTSYDEPDDA
jgi:hypothetical protein